MCPPCMRRLLVSIIGLAVLGLASGAAANSYTRYFDVTITNITANQVFTPSEEAVTEAREILAAMEEAKAKGEGATVYKGRLVDIASIKQAEVIVAQAELIAASA